MNLPATSERGILMDYLYYFSPQAAGNLPKEIKITNFIRNQYNKYT